MRISKCLALNFNLHIMKLFQKGVRVHAVLLLWRLLKVAELLRSFCFIIAHVVLSLHDRVISHYDTLFWLIHFPETEFIFHFSAHTEIQSYFLFPENAWEKEAFVAGEFSPFSLSGLWWALACVNCHSRAEVWNYVTWLRVLFNVVHLTKGLICLY